MDEEFNFKSSKELSNREENTNKEENAEEYKPRLSRSRNSSEDDGNESIIIGQKSRSRINKD